MPWHHEGRNTDMSNDELDFEAPVGTGPDRRHILKEPRGQLEVHAKASTKD